jgi:hypothetical protein
MPTIESETTESERALAAPAQLSFSPEIFELPFLEATKRFIHTGRRLLSDPELIESIVSDLRLGASLRTVCARYHKSHNTIAAILECLEQNGKLDTLERRISRKLGVASEMALDCSLELLHAGKVPANVLPIMLGVFSDKKALLDGRPTSIVQHTEREISVSALNSLVTSLPIVDVDVVPGEDRPAPALALESQSTAIP